MPFQRTPPIERATPSGDIVAGAVTLGLVGLAALVILPLGIFVPARVAGTVNSPGFFPHLLLIAGGLLGTLLSVKGLRERRAWPAGRGASLAEWLRAAAMLAVAGGYVALIPVVGLPLASSLALAAGLVHFGERRALLVVTVALAVPLVLWAFFVRVAGVPMPDSLLGHWLQAFG